MNSSWMNRRAAQADLQHRLPAVLQQAEMQMDEMLAVCAPELLDEPVLRLAA